MTHGGKRKGAGRKEGSGKWGEPTKVLRLPESRISEILSILDSGSIESKRPVKAVYA